MHQFGGSSSSGFLIWKPPNKETPPGGGGSFDQSLVSFKRRKVLSCLHGWRGKSLKHLLDAESRVVYIHIDVCVVYRIHKTPSLLLSRLFSTGEEERAYNICKTQHSVRFLSFTYSATWILASDSHSIFWNSDFRQRFPLKSTEIWRSKKHRFCVLKFPLSPLHLTRGYTYRCICSFLRAQNADPLIPTTSIPVLWT